jgi:hypothetical protein
MKKEETPVLLWAPPEYWQLTPAQRADICNGCGAKGWGGYIVPDTLLGLSITDACHIHDYMYHTGETLDDKRAADRVFLNNALRLIEAGTQWPWLQRARTRRAHVYYQAVSNFGGPAFWSDKNLPGEMGSINCERKCA